MYKDRGDDMIHTGPVWDFDLAFENDNRTYPIMSLSDYIYKTKGSCAGNMRTFVNNIVVYNTAAKNQLKNIWAEVREGGLTEDYMTSYVDAWEQTLSQSQALNFTRWPIMNQYVHQNPKLWGSYEAEVQNVRRYIKERIAWMDNKLGYDFQPSAISETISSADAPIQIYNLQGIYCGSSLDTLPTGVYVVRHGDTVKKVRK